MWQTKYASAVPKKLGVGVEFRPCCEGNFLTGRPQSVFGWNITAKVSEWNDNFRTKITRQNLLDFAKKRRASKLPQGDVIQLFLKVLGCLQGTFVLLKLSAALEAVAIKAKATVLKFMYSEKATKFCEISTLDLSYEVPVKSTVEISQNFVAFSEYMNFTMGQYLFL